MAGAVAALGLIAGPAAAAPDYSPVVKQAAERLKAGDGAGALHILESADKGDSFARMLTAEIYQGGMAGVPADPDKACDIFETLVAVQPEAPHNLAQCFYDGRGRPRDLAAARVWYQKGIDLGFPQSSCALGNMMIRGEGGAPEPDKGLALCRKAADAGDANAQADMGEHYLLGEGVAVDYVQARAWYLKGARQGQRNAAFRLAALYWNGDGGPTDQTEAARWWKVAYQNGRTDAAPHLAAWYFAKFMSAHAAGDTSDLDEAIKWQQAVIAYAADANKRQEAQTMLKLMQEARKAAANEKR